jgi:hypothetical protein
MEQKRTLGFRLESEANKYTNNETLSSIDYCFSVFNISYSTEIGAYMRKLARGDWSKDASVSGRQNGTVSFSVDFHEHANADAAPMYWTMLRACAMQQNSNAGTGVWLTPNAIEDRNPASIEIVEREEGATPRQKVVKLFGCAGNARLILDTVGNPYRVDFEFRGAIGSISTRAYGSLITPASFDTEAPSAVLCATINLFATIQYLNSMTIDLGNVIEPFTDPSKCQGIDGYHIVDRNPILELDPDMRIPDDIDLHANQTSNTTGTLSVEVGRRMTVSAPAAQLVQTNNPAAREGHVTDQIRLELKRSSGNDELEFLQGSKT